MSAAGGTDPRVVVDPRPGLAYAKAQVQLALDQDPDRIILRPEDARLVLRFIECVEMALDVADERDRLEAALAAAQERTAAAEARAEAAERRVVRARADALEEAARVAERFPKDVQEVVHVPEMEDLTSGGTPYIAPSWSFKRNRPATPHDVVVAIRALQPETRS